MRHGVPGRRGFRKMAAWLEKLKEGAAFPVLAGEPSAARASYRAGGPFEALALPGSADELSGLLRLASSLGVPVTVLGAMTNVLVGDRGLPGLALSTAGLRGLAVEGTTLRLAAGEPWDNAVRAACEAGLEGLERTSGIPGTVGGAVRMNAGAYGQETFDTFESAEVADGAGERRVLMRGDLRWSYRSVPGLAGLTVLSATFKLARAGAEGLEAERARILAARAAGQPLDLPSAGSVFRRPQGDYASRLIDACGLKGLARGGAAVSEKHAGFIVNTGGATAADIKGLMDEVRERVRERTGVELCLEQVLLGDF
ncbi:MAG: UDP-N-acetylmuramate dehydrogenase [Elusimicrobia bacterium]|nr:MAG: UDP-N-acetylmuramate dehydrogenase [Elusimicrobiota bacterium]KAF0154557.1 MAG: UDP-N-acetylmuramate dehydrogenase [Elusimicrobiota bacterium]